MVLALLMVPTMLAWSASPAFAAPPLDLKSTITEVRPALRSKSPSDRIGALRKIAAVAKEPPGPPSPEVVRALVDGLEDEHMDVRVKTVALVVAHQDSAAALQALLDALSRAERELKVIETEARKIHAKSNVGAGGGAMTGTEAVRLLQAPEYVGTILEALGHIQDARSESALIAAVERPHEKTPATVHDDAFRGLLQLWSARGVEAAIDALASFEKALAKRKKDDEPVRKGIGADLFVFVFEPLTPETVDELYEHLANAATTAGAPGPADGDGDRGSRWKSWFEQNRGLFTEKLGKATGVVDVTLRDRREKSTSKGGK